MPTVPTATDIVRRARERSPWRRRRELESRLATLEARMTITHMALVSIGSVSTSSAALLAEKHR
jgi:hypothetical protein